MSNRAELAAHLHVQLRDGLRLQDATRVLQALEDEVLVPHGLYLNGDVEHSEGGSDAPARIVGVLVRADGRDLRELDVELTRRWLQAKAEVTKVTFGPLKRAEGPDEVQ